MFQNFYVQLLTKVENKSHNFHAVPQVTVIYSFSEIKSTFPAPCVVKEIQVDQICYRYQHYRATISCGSDGSVINRVEASNVPLLHCFVIVFPNMGSPDID